MSELILGVDIGGTKTLLKLVSLAGDIVAQSCCNSKVFQSFELMLDEFLLKAGNQRPKSACIAVAGIVSEGEATVTKLPWRISARKISDQFGIKKVHLINDFVAVAIGLDEIADCDLEQLQGGICADRGVQVVVGAGTGLGVAWRVWDGAGYIPLDTEAGHTDFSPNNECESRLAQWLRHKYGHATWDQVVSGPGIVNLHHFLKSEDTENIAKELIYDPALILEMANEQGDPVAVEAIELFLKLYGAFCGNLALLGMTRGGVFIAGGIAPKIIGRLRRGGFVKSFLARSHFADFMANIPIKVVLNQNIGLQGALADARSLISHPVSE